MTETCEICHGDGTLVVGWSQVPGSTYKVKWERDPCPGCTPPPHSFHAKLKASRVTAEKEPAHD